MLRRRVEEHYVARDEKRYPVTDVAAQTDELRQVAVIGDPGAGKTFTMWHMALDLAGKAEQDPAAPIPLLVDLGEWTSAGQSLRDFLKAAAPELAPILAELVAASRVALLLDGLDRIPPDQRAAKARSILAEVDGTGRIMVFTCRERDWDALRDLELEQAFHRIHLQPLTPAQVKAFLTAYLDPYKEPGAGEDAFWKLAGGPEASEVRVAWQKFEAAGIGFEEFWAGCALDGRSAELAGGNAAA